MFEYGWEDPTFFKPHKQVKFLLNVETSGKSQPWSCDYFSIVMGLFASETTSVDTVQNTKVIDRSTVWLFSAPHEPGDVTIPSISLCEFQLSHISVLLDKLVWRSHSFVGMVWFKYTVVLYKILFHSAESLLPPFADDGCCWYEHWE